MSRSEEKKSKYHFDISDQVKRETKSSRAERQLDHVTKTSLKISSQVENAKDETGIIPPPVWPQIIIDRNRGNYVTSIQVSSELPPTTSSITTSSRPVSCLSLESEKDTRQQDSIVTQSLLMLMTNSESDNKSVESETHSAGAGLVIKNKQHQNLSGAISSARRSFRGLRGTIRSSSRKIVRRKPGRNKTGSLRSAGSVEAVRELWSKTGMRTNGRKLLLGARDTEAAPSSQQEEVNAGYESDNSQVSVPREGLARSFPLPATTRRQASSSSSSSSLEEGGERARQGRAGLRKGERRQIGDPDRIESVERSEESNTAKHVRFHHPRYLREPRQQPRPVHNLLWDKYYGATEAGLRLGSSSSNLGSDFTMDPARNKSLMLVDKRRRRMKCCCKISCFVLLLVSFLLVIITVTYLLTKGKRYFGAL